jgi:hypothetical protein
MSRSEYEAALSEFLRSKGVTRCPTACVAPTYGAVAATDKAALRSYGDGREAARIAKLLALRGGRTPPSIITLA